MRTRSLPISVTRAATIIMLALCPGSPPTASADPASALADTSWQTFRAPAGAMRVRLVDPSPDDRVLPINVNNYWGLINRHGDFVAAPRLDWIDDPVRGLARAVVGGKTGYIRLDGDFVIDPQFDWADRFADDMAIVRNPADGKHGFINRAGRLAVPARFDGALRFADGFAAVSVDGRVGYLNRAGNLVIEPRFAVGRSFVDGQAFVRLFGETPPRAGDAGADTRALPPPGDWALIDKRGEVRWRDRTGRVAEVRSFQDGAAAFAVEAPADAANADPATPPARRWGYFDRAMNVLVPPRFAGLRDFRGGLAAAQAAPDHDGPGVAGRWGFIDKRGVWVVAPQLDDAEELRDGLVLVRIAGAAGFLNRAGSRGITPTFEFAEPFVDGLARVARPRGGGFTYIDVSGRAIIDFGDVAGDGRRFRDETLGRQIRENVSGTPTIRPYFFTVPAWRPPPAIPYPPDYLYEDRLPIAGP